MTEMTKSNILTLISESPAARGVNEPATGTERDVFCTVRSVGMRESYEALSHGFTPELVFILAQDFEYQGEKRCSCDGVYYDIIRTYVTEADGIELTVQRSTKQG